MKKSNKYKLVVVPNDPIIAYEKKGIDWLETYYNPTNMFDKVYAISPLEKRKRKAYGMYIRNIQEKNFKQEIKKIRPNIIRGYNGDWCADLICYNKVKGVPVVLSVHNVDKISKSIRYADIIICMSKAVEKVVLKAGANPEQIRILPNRIDISKFTRISDEKRLQDIRRRFPKGKFILHIGRKCMQKNLDTVIKSLQYLPDDHFVVFIGRGNEDYYRKMAYELGVSERCFWIESVNNSELPLWYSSCDCFCVPSRYEGFGVVFIEAAACGTPIITSNIEPMNEYLNHNENAYLISDYEDAKQLAKAIYTVCSDDKLKKMLSENAIKMARNFDKKKIDLLEASIYHEALQIKQIRYPNIFSKIVFKLYYKNLSVFASIKKTFRCIENCFAWIK